MPTYIYFLDIRSSSHNSHSLIPRNIIFRSVLHCRNNKKQLGMSLFHVMPRGSIPGMAPQHAQEGDVIFIPWGSRVPFAVRKFRRTGRALPAHRPLLPARLDARRGVQARE